MGGIRYEERRERRKDSDVDTLMDGQWCGTSGPERGTAGKTQVDWNGQGRFLQNNTCFLQNLQNL